MHLQRSLCQPAHIAKQKHFPIEFVASAADIEGDLFLKLEIASNALLFPSDRRRFLCPRYRSA